MRHPLHTLGRLMVGLALGSTAVFAQTPGFDVQFKLRSGLQLGAAKDGLQRHLMGAGVEVGYTIGQGRLGLELGYQYKPGRQYAMDVTQTPVAAGAPAPVAAFSGDLRRNQVDGIAARVSYGHAVAKDLEVVGGLQFGGAKFRQEFVGQAATIDPKADYFQTDSKGVPLVGAMPAYADTYSGVGTKSGLSVAPFVGLRFRLNDVSSLEVNVIGMTYKTADYVHVAGTTLATVSDFYPWGGKFYRDVDLKTLGGHTGKDYTTSTSRMIPHIELGWALRF